MGKKKRLLDAIANINVDQTSTQIAEKYDLPEEEVKKIMEKEIGDIRGKIEEGGITVPNFLASLIVKATKEKVRRKLGS